MTNEAGFPVETPAPERRDPRTTIGGRYAIDLDAPLGSGGMCLVYRGQDLRTRRDIAVKTLRLEYRRDPETRARFRREARLIAFLAHPNVIRVIDFVDDRGTSWVVLEHVPGRALNELLKENGALPLATVAHILDQAAAALGHLHARGLVHLDVKPQNLLLTPGGDLKLIDFGLAQPVGGPQQAINGRTFGTIGYLAPEQLRGESVDATADVYALGGVIYEALTGAPPYPPPASGEITNSVIRSRLTQMPVPPSLANPAVPLPAWVDDVVLWALAPEPRARYGSAAAFARIFRAGLDGDGLPAEPPARAGPTPAEVIPIRDSGREHPDPLAPPSAAAVNVPAHFGRAPERGFGALRREGSLGRRSVMPRRLLWWAVLGLVFINLMLALLLLTTQGRLPGVYDPGLIVFPGGMIPYLGETPTVRAPRAEIHLIAIALLTQLRRSFE